MPDAAAILDTATTRIVLANHAAARMFGFPTPEEMVGENPLNYIPEEDRERVALMMADSFQRDYETPTELRIRTRDGRLLWVSVNVSLIEYDGKKATMTTVRDITLEKAKDAALREVEHQYENLFQGMLDGAVVLDMSTFRIALANKAAARMFGFDSPRDMVGENPLSYILEEDRDEVARMIALNLDGKGRNPAEIQVTTRDNRQIWVSATATKIVHEGRTATLTTLRDMTADKAKDAALDAAERSKMQLIDAATESIFIIQEGKFVYVNPAAAKAAGLSQQQMIGHSLTDFVHPEEKQAVMERYEKLASGRFIAGPTTVRGTNASGQVIWSEAQDIPFSWRGKPAIMTLVTDVTDRIRREEERKEREELLRTIVENAWDGLVIFDENYQVIFESPTLSKITGYTTEEWKGSSPTQWPVHPDDLASTIATLQTLKGQPGSTVGNVRMRFRRKDGSWLWIEATGRNLLQDSRVKGLVVNFRDITENVRAEEALKASEERFRTLIEKATDVVVVLDADGKTKYESSSLQRVTGYEPHEWLGRSLTDFIIHPDDVPPLAADLERLLAQPGAAFEGICARYRHKNGSWHTLEATVTNMLLDPKVNGIVANFRDITERKRAEEALRESEEKYKRLFESTQTAIEVISGETGLIVLANEATARIFGFASAHDLLGIDPLQFLKPEDRGWVVKGIARALADKGWHELAELPVRTTNGRWLWISGMAVQTEYQGKPAMLVSMLDITSRKQVEETLRQSEGMYRLLAENINDVVWTSDLDLHLTYVSPSVERMLSFTPEERLHQDLTQQMTPESLVRAQELLQEQLELEREHRSDQNQTVKIDLEYSHKNGSTVWTENLISGIRDSDGTLLGFHGVARDITERRKSEHALKQSEERYRLLAENASDIIWVTDANLKITYASPATTRVLGYTFEEVTAISIDRLLTPDSLASIIRVFEDAFARERDIPGSMKESTFETEVVRKDGSKVWLEVAVNMIRNSEGQVVGFQGACRDISEHRRAQEALRLSEERFRTLIEESTDAIAILDATGILLYESHSMERITGYRLDDWLNTPLTDWLIHPDDLGALATTLERVLGEPNATVENLTARFRHKDGTWHTLEATVRNLLHDPKVGGLVINYRDITDRVKVQEALAISEAKYRALFDHTMLGMEVIDTQSGTVVLANHSLARMFGFKSPSDMIGTNPMSYVLPEDLEWVSNQMAQLMADPSWNKQAVIRSKTEDGRLIWVTGMITPFEYEGRPSMLLSLIDTTAAREAEIKLQESEEKNRLLIDNAAEAIAVIQDGATKFFNRRLVELTGWSHRELFAKSFLELVHPDERETIALNYMKRVASEEVPNNYQFRIIDKTGKTKWLQVNAVRLNWEGKPASLTMFSDVTEQVKAEKAVRDSEERFRGLVETSSDWVWEIDRDGKYTYVSPKVRDILGYEPHELIGHTPFEFMHQREGHRVSRIMGRFASEHLPFSLLENTSIHKDGHSVVLETSAVPILDADGNFLGYRGIDRDITERKKVEHELQHSVKRLEKTMESTIEAITTTIETRDPYTTGHQMRVTDLACVIAKVMEIPPTQIEGIRVAGLLHDIGKIAIPTEILSKPGKLNEVEYEMIKTHAKVGYNILKKIEFPWPVAKAVLQHHERWDGSGYPHGLRGENILLEARILAVADVMEAMSSHRPYRPSIGADKALDEITKNSGILYDPAVTEACVSAFTQAGFEFASSAPSVAGEGGGMPSDRAVHPTENR